MTQISTDAVLAHVEATAFADGATFDDVDERVAVMLGVPYHVIAAHHQLALACARYAHQHQLDRETVAVAASAPGSSGAWPTDRPASAAGGRP